MLVTEPNSLPSTPARAVEIDRRNDRPQSRLDLDRGAGALEFRAIGGFCRREIGPVPRDIGKGEELGGGEGNRRDGLLRSCHRSG